MIVPESRNANCNPIIVSTGIMALRKACLHGTARIGAPLARGADVVLLEDFDQGETW